MRVFRLPFAQENHSRRDEISEALGLVSPFAKSHEDFQRSLAKINQELVDRVLLPRFATSHKRYGDYVEAINRLGKEVLQVVTPRDVHDDFPGTKKLIVSTNPEDLNLETNHDFLFILTKSNVKQVLTLDVEVLKKKPYFYIPAKVERRDNYLSVKKTYSFLKKMKKKEFAPLTYPGFSVMEMRAPVDMEFEPIKDSRVLSKVSDSPLMSIIIPVFNQSQYVMKTLEHLSAQVNISLDSIEVIVVDDGGSDGLESAIESMNSLPNLSYQYFHRYVEREMGDFRFRAGIARNLGFKSARGQYLLFLDADVLLPRNALSRLLEDIRDKLLIQVQRFDLTQKACNENIDIHHLSDEHLIFKGRDYWYDFFKEGHRWNSLEHCWKYVCTYGLCMTRADFIELGGFRTNYIGYGFEDTDLGFRFKKKGGEFLLSDLKAFHQYHEEERSEFRNNVWLRQKVLARTAKTFFMNNLDPEIYESLRSYM